MLESKAKMLTIKRIFLILLPVLLLLPMNTASAARVPVEEWNRTFGGSAEDCAWAVSECRDGGYILTGYTSSFGAGGNDFWLIKTDSSGNQSWNRTFGGSAEDIACSVLECRDGGYILAGSTSSFGAGGNDFWLVKTDSEGKELWNRTFGGPSDDGAWHVKECRDGGYILAGYASSFGGINDFWLVKTDSEGKELWNRTFRGSSYDGTCAVSECDDGGYILAGSMYSSDKKNDDFWLVKTDSEGKELWNRTFGGPYYEGACAVSEAKDGGYILAGRKSSSDSRNYDFWLVKTDSDGNETWNKTFGSFSYDIAYGVQECRDGGYILTGSTSSFGAGKSDIWLIKTDTEGNELWNKTFGGPANDCAYAVLECRDGGYILAGSTASFGAGKSDFWLVKANTYPYLNYVGNRSVTETKNLNFTLKATYIGGSNLIYGGSLVGGKNLPFGAELNTSTGEFNWTPSNTQAGFYPIEFNVSDGVDQDSEIVNITVKDDYRSYLLGPIGNREIDENSTLNITLQSVNPDGAVLNYSVTGLPKGAIFNNTTGVFKWTPTYGQAGNYTLEFQANNGPAYDNEKIIITVNRVNSEAGAAARKLLETSSENKTEKNLTEENLTEKNITQENLTEKNITEENLTEKNITEGQKASKKVPGFHATYSGAGVLTAVLFLKRKISI